MRWEQYIGLSGLAHSSYKAPYRREERVTEKDLTTEPKTGHSVPQFHHLKKGPIILFTL